MSGPSKAALSALLSELDTSKTLTVAQAWDLRKVETKPVALERLEFAWKALLPHFGAKAIASLKPADFHSYVKRRTSGKQAVAASTVRRELGELSTTINHMVKTKRVSSLHVPHVPLPPPGKPRTAYLSKADKERVLAMARSRREDPNVPSRVELFCVIGWEAGQRRRAIETLEWSQVDFAHKVIHFAKSEDVPTKKRKVSVPMSTALLALLKAEHERFGAQCSYVLRGSGSIRTAFESLMKACELEAVTPHTLRHTFVSHLLMRDKPVYTVAQLAGMTVKMVETTYGHVSMEHLRSALD